MAMQTAEVAQAEGNSKLVLQAILQVTRISGIILKQDFQPDSNLVYEILASPQWAAQDSLLPHDPQVLSASRQALAGTLLSPCPDTAAPSPPQPLKELDLFTENLLNLAQPAAQPKTENRLFKQWEKSGKLPGKAALDRNNAMESQGYSRREKNTGKNPKSCQAGAWLDELVAGRVDFDYLNAIGVGRKLPDPLAIFQEALSPVSTA